MVKLILTFSDHMLYWLYSTKLGQNITPKKACQFQQSTKSSPMDMEENDLLFGTHIFFIKYNLNVDFVTIKWNRLERCCFVYYQLTGLTIILMFFQDCFWHKIEKKKLRIMNLWHVRQNICSVKVKYEKWNKFCF